MVIKISSKKMTSPTAEVLDRERKGVSATIEPRVPKEAEAVEASEFAAESAGDTGGIAVAGSAIHEPVEGEEAMEAAAAAAVVVDVKFDGEAVSGLEEAGEEERGVASEGERSEGGGEAMRRGDIALRCGEVMGVRGGESGDTTGVS